MDSLELNKEQENVTQEVNKTEQVAEETVSVAEDNVVSESSEKEMLPEATVKTDLSEPSDMPSADGKPAAKVEGTDYNAMDRVGLVQALKSLLEKEVDEARDEVELIKQMFYKKLKSENEEKKKSFVEAGGDESDYKPEKDDLESQLKAMLADFKSKKAAYLARIEQERENNLIQKQHILEQMKSLTETTDDVSSHITEFKDLQQRWKNIGPVASFASNDLWKQYNLLQEKFWDLIKINNELREYDFKKNFETKVLLCEAAEKLSEETDVVAASRQLQKLHEEWREVGPVARDLREELWNRFKDATTLVNKKHQSYFEEQKKNEEENLQLKVAICEKIEGFDISGLKTYVAWDEATQTILQYQEEWKTIGFAPRKANQKVYERYRNACDAFFAAKNSFYKGAKAELAENLEKKRALCEQAEALKDSTDWKETTDKLVKIQKDWKEVGPVPKKYSDDLWKRFIAACDYFFDQKNKLMADQRSEEVENIQKKRDIISRIESLSLDNASEAYVQLKELIQEFRNVGHVPFKEKDKIYKQYRAAIDKQFDALNIDAANRRLDTFRNNLEDMSGKGEQKLYREREKLVRTYEHLKSEIATYENNMGFFSATSKNANKLLKGMEDKIENLKKECALIEQKINMIEEKL